MSLSSSYDAKEQVRAAIDIVDLIGGYIELRRQGRSYTALCPFHNDRRPSLQINPERQIWRCFVCEIGGDIFSFVMRKESVDFREALSILADRAGITLRPNRGDSKSPDGDNKATLYAAMAWTEKLFHECLMRAQEAEPARRYLRDRGITEHTAERFHLGFSPHNWQWLMDRTQSSSFSTKVMESVGMLGVSPNSGRRYDRFRGRLMFPIRDTQDRTVAFGGRILPQFADEKSAKYINSPETRLFSKSDQLYGLNVARNTIQKQKEVVVVEGYTDVLMANQNGVENVVAVLGTSLGSRHVRVLRRYADRVTLVLDGDEAGKKRTNEILELFVAEDVDLRILTLPEQIDPCDFVHQQGGPAFQQMVHQAIDALEHKIRVETSGIDPLRDVHLASQALEHILRTLAKAPRLNASSSGGMSLRQQQLLPRLAREFRVPESEVRSRLSDLRRNSRRDTGRQQPSSTPQEVRLDPFECELLEMLTQQPEAVPLAAKFVAPEHFSPGPLRDLYSVYCQMAQRDDFVRFEQLLTELEAPELKDLLVRLEDQASRKAEMASGEAENRVEGLIEHFRQRGDEMIHREHRAALEQRQLSESEELEILQDLMEKERNRQGISAPTDG